MPYLSEIPSNSIAILAPDLPAHGKTEWESMPGDFTPELVSAEVESLIKLCNPNSLPVILCGVSLGATVALRIAAKNSVGVIGVIFFRPSHDVSPASHLQINIDIADFIETVPSREELLKALENHPRYQEIAATSASDARALTEKALRSYDSGRVRRLREGSGWVIPPEWFQALSVPVSIVGCADDYLHPLSLAQAWKARCADSTLVTLPSKDGREEHWNHLAAAILREKVNDLVGERKQ